MNSRDGRLARLLHEDFEQATGTATGSGGGPVPAGARSLRVGPALEQARCADCGFTARDVEVVFAHCMAGCPERLVPR